MKGNLEARISFRIWRNKGSSSTIKASNIAASLPHDVDAGSIPPVKPYVGGVPTLFDRPGLSGWLLRQFPRCTGKTLLETVKTMPIPTTTAYKNILPLHMGQIMYI
jgi:hypothetical protein